MFKSGHSSQNAFHLKNNNQWEPFVNPASFSFLFNILSWILFCFVFCFVFFFLCFSVLCLLAPAFLRVTSTFLEFHFDLAIVFLSVSLCIAFYCLSDILHFIYNVYRHRYGYRYIIKVEKVSLHLPEECQRRFPETQDLNKIQSLIILQWPDYNQKTIY